MTLSGSGSTQGPVPGRLADATGTRWATALAHRGGSDFWRGLDELLETPEFRATLRREFPEDATLPDDAWSRRSFVKLLGASVALAGLGACINVPDEKMLPFVDQPPEVTPGVPRYYATSMVVGGYATGLLAESHAGRPTKLEGNPLHPASLGAAGIYEQASVLQLYDPDRLRGVRNDGKRATWEQFEQRVLAPVAQRTDGGAGLVIILEPTSSPLVASQLARLRALLPAVRVYFHDPLAPTGALEGAQRAFGAPLVTRYDFSAADVLVLLDADLLSNGPFHMRHARQVADRRRVLQPTDGMSRLYVAETEPSPTGTIADERLRARARDVPRLLAALLGELDSVGATSGLSEREQGWVAAAALDLRASAGRSVVAVGERQPWMSHVLAHAINERLGNVGRTVSYAQSAILEAGSSAHDIGNLYASLQSQPADTVLVLGGNPVYTSPADVALREAISTVRDSAYLGLYLNETASACHWAVPQAHYLEGWGDSCAYDGTASLTQPLVQPLWGGRTTSELLAAMLGDPPGGRAQLRDQWRGTLTSDAEWDGALQRGFVENSALPPTSVTMAPDALPAAVAAASALTARNGMEIVFRQDASVRDGSFSNNAWLQELPDPLSKLTWGNAAIVSPATGARLNVETGNVLRLSYRDRELDLPALVLPGHADGSVSVHMGYGRKGAERVARDVGGNVYNLWTTAAPYADDGLSLTSVVGAQVKLAITQDHWAMEGRPAALGATLDEYRADPDFAKPKGRELSLYKPYDYDSGDQWAMVVDLSTCTGCSACVVACQAENNVPVVGKEAVLRHREMHWLRVDRYFGGDVADPTVAMQPMLCQHCEKAPCEYVCPVNATVHSPDGLNEMIYNRCVGTRFCSNNCPYKVRRFNWFNYNAELDETERLAKNPDVTVRDRGVMEKCTFCVQRIRRAQQAAMADGKRVEPGEVVTACQQSCPTNAISFGSLTNPDDTLVRRLAARRRYAALEELGTQPRVTYLARITNPAKPGTGTGA